VRDTDIDGTPLLAGGDVDVSGHDAMVAVASPLVIPVPPSSPNSHLSSSQGGAAAKRRCRPWDPCLNIAAALGAGRKTPFLRRARLHRSGMDPRVKPEDDNLGGAALVRKSPPEKIHPPPVTPSDNPTPDRHERRQ